MSKDADESGKLTYFKNLVNRCPMREKRGKKEEDIRCGYNGGQKCDELVKTAEKLLKNQQYEADFPCLSYVMVCDEMGLKKETTPTPLGLETFHS